MTLLRPARDGEPERPGTRFFKPLRQVIESINDTFKGQLDLERHGGPDRRGAGSRHACLRMSRTVLGGTVTLVPASSPLIR
jgi:hypothetical protein